FLTCYPYNTDAKTLVWILAVVNAMQSMYNDGTLTRKIIQFVIIKVEIFKTRQVGFHITKDAEAFLNNFCTWQSRVNTPDDRDPRHWDHAL
ncbi:hypothetical protein, partial [Listeria monocytogenes]|uniref:hypothetical protein n=1 Tax=Listeria monocytogenes TaxID=1639 RepID=UPI00249782F4